MFHVFGLSKKVSKYGKIPLKPGNVNVFLVKDKINFIAGNNDSINIEGITMDTKPNGGGKGIVVAFHGAPGSHEDFKYLVPYLEKLNYRFIVGNYPGFGIVQHNDKMTMSNDERYNYGEAILKARKVSPKEKIVFIGHSRGCDLTLKFGALKKEQTVGICIINGVGIRPHKGIKPNFPIVFLPYLWDNFPFLRSWFIQPFVGMLYRMLKIRTKSSLEAVNAIRTINSFDLPKQADYVEMFNKQDSKVLIAAAGHDWLIEKEIIIEFAQLFKDMKFIYNLEKSDVASNEVKNAYREGKKGLFLFFQNDGHFLAKYRADVIATAIDEMFKSVEK
uniref:Hydrolase_4 domain-containing protein n=1 Tax=Parastrongyloides trichosuri TaxID=131310 RepID=A0A0N4Z4N5_PARTI